MAISVSPEQLKSFIPFGDLTDEIIPYVVRDVIRDMDYALCIPNVESLTLYINSPGGEPSSAMALYDYIISTQTCCTIRGIVRGQAASAASMIVLQATSPRFATAQSRLHLHEPSKWLHEGGPTKASALRDDADELTRIEGIVLSILAKRAGKDVEDLRKELGRRETWMSAAEAKEWGLIDAVRDA